MKSIITITHKHTGSHFLKKLLPEFGNVMSILDPQEWVNDGLVPDCLYLQGWQYDRYSFKNLKILHACDVHVVSAIRHPLRVYGTFLRFWIRKWIPYNKMSVLRLLKDMLVKYKKFLEHTISLREEPNFYLVYIDQMEVMNPEDRIDAIMEIFRPLNLKFTKGSNRIISKWIPVNSHKNSGVNLEFYNSIYEECLEETFNGLNSCSELLKDLCDSDLIISEHNYGNSVPFSIENI